MDDIGLFLQLLKDVADTDLTNIDMDNIVSRDSNYPSASPTRSTIVNESGMKESGDDDTDLMLFQDIESILRDAEEHKSERSWCNFTIHLESETEHSIDEHSDKEQQPFASLLPEMGCGRNATESSHTWSLLKQNPDNAIYDTENIVSDRHSIELLRRELAYLEAQRDFLQFQAHTTNAIRESNDVSGVSYQQNARKEYQKLRAAAQLRQRMVECLIQQRQSCHELERLILQSPLTNYRSSLIAPIESYIRLTKDFRERRATLQSIRDSKIASVVQYITHQTRYMDLEQEFHYMDTFEQFGKLYMVDIGISKLEHTTIKEVTEALFNRIIKRRAGVPSTMGSKSTREVKTKIFDGVEDSFMNARDVDRMNIQKDLLHDRDYVILESNTVFFHQAFDNMSVFCCDYVNEDELHPYRMRGRIRKNMTAGIVLSPHMSVDGERSVIMKRYSFITHHLQQHSCIPELIQTVSAHWILFSQSIRYCMTQQQHPTAETSVRVVRHHISA